MIEFHAPLLSDKAWVNARLAHAGMRGCEYNFTNLFIWNKSYGQTIAEAEGCLVVRTGKGMYFWPVGGDVHRALEALRSDAAERGVPFRLTGLTSVQAEQLEAWYPGQFTFTENRDGWDYLYEIDRLADLKGKKLHAKRNHCNKFLQMNPGWSYEEITRENLDECIELDREWYLRSLPEDGSGTPPEEREEGCALFRAVENFEDLGLEGGIIRIDGKVVAFTIGDKMAGDVYNVHFEKAYGEIQGAYPMINREFARWVRERYPDVRYLNREEDMGLEGLRKAKESYYPDLMVAKLFAEEAAE